MSERDDPYANVSIAVNASTYMFTDILHLPALCVCHLSMPTNAQCHLNPTKVSLHAVIYKTDGNQPSELTSKPVSSRIQ
jgi:hypothetical protein